MNTRSSMVQSSPSSHKVCYLCGKENIYMSQYSTWSEESKSFVARHLGKSPPDTARVCRKDFFEASRHHNDISYEPKWKVNKTHTLLCCVYPQCNNNSRHGIIITASFAPEDTLRQIIGITGNEQIQLCKQHYIIYREANPSKKCASCHANPKIGAAFHLRCPDPQKINNYLRASDTVTDEITPEDKICKTCYKMMLSILPDLAVQPISIDNNSVWTWLCL